MKKYLVEVIALIFAFIFVYAAISKLSNIDRFKLEMGQSPLLIHYANYLAWIVPITEILIAVFLLESFTRLIGFYASFGLMVLFTTYFIVILNFADNVPCSCGGVLSNLSWKEHLTFNVALLLLAITGVFLKSKPKPRLLQQVTSKL